MRPALLRLLKRQSSITILDSLASTPVGIEQLEAKYTQLRCQSRYARSQLSTYEEDGSWRQREYGVSKENERQSRPHPQFSVYEIEPPSESQPQVSFRHAACPDGKKRTKCARKSPIIPQERLEFESDLGHTDDIGSRLVDCSEYKNNFELWEELLRFRQRHYGDEGTRVIWEGISARLEGVGLPVSGDRADFFWQSFLNLGLSQELLMQSVVHYAIELWQRDGSRWPRLYQCVVGGLLDRGMAKQALHWHQKLQHSGIANPDDLLQVLEPALWPAYAKHEASSIGNLFPRPIAGRRQIFKNLCRFTTGHRIYGPVISTLVQQGHGEDALSMHDFFIRRQDHPKDFQELQPLLDYADKYGRRKEFEDLRSYARQQFPLDAAGLDHVKSEKTEVSARKRNVAGSSTKGLSKKDELGARLFATRALNFDMVLGSFKLLGVSEIGPRTLREMATKADGSPDILAKLKMMRQSGLKIEDCVFTRLVQKLAAQSRDILLSDVLHSDLHPDVFEDASVQESLLISNYMAQDTRQYNLSLAVLAEHFPNPQDLLNIHFRKHISAGEYSAAFKIVDELTLRGKMLSEGSVDFMAEKVLTARRMRHRPPPGQHSTRDEVMAVFKVLQRVVPAGGYVSAAFWEEMLKRLGMGGFWKELRQCCHWLARQYCRSPGWNMESVNSSSDGAPVTGRDGRMLELIFTREMQAAIVSWGFLFRVTSESISTHSYPHPVTGEKLIPWVRGLVLLRELEQIGGLRLRDGEIRKATRHRLQMLFGNYCHSARRMNRMLRRRNPYNLQRVLDDANRAWGMLLFEGSGQNYFERLVNPWRSPWSRRRSAKVILARKSPR